MSEQCDDYSAALWWADRIAVAEAAAMSVPRWRVMRRRRLLREVDTVRAWVAGMPAEAVAVWRSVVTASG